jgi:3-keto steroid reductase
MLYEFKNLMINSGLGFSIASRLVTEFLSTSAPTAHLVLILTTRSPLKTRLTISRLRAHLRTVSEYSQFANASREKAKAQGKTYKWEGTIQRVHFLGIELDLCDLRNVYEVSSRLKNGEIGSPDAQTSEGLRLPEGSPGTAGFDPNMKEQDRWALSQKPGSTGVARSWGWGLQGIRVPRLDVMFLNAGIGGWKGLDWGLAVKTVLLDTVQATTWPEYKIANFGAVVRSKSSAGPSATKGSDEATQTLLSKQDGHKSDEPPLGEVFCANIFGHYVISHELMPLLSRPSTSFSPPGKIIWISSIEALPESFSSDDIQGLQSVTPYESTKRLTDILAFTASLPSVSRISESYFSIPEEKIKLSKKGDVLVKPKIYVAHPGICSTDIIALNFILQFFMELAFYLARLLGSPWHTIDSYKGAVAPVWIALAGEETLENMQGGMCKWGSATDWWGEERVSRTEVGGWGWNGEMDGGEGAKREDGVTERRKGRKRGTVDLTREAREEFEVLGGKCWKEMEELRVEWEERLGVKGGKTTK